MAKRTDLTGQQFNYWTVIDYAYSKNGQTYWNCRCKCGTERAIRGYALKSERSKSCGCFFHESVGLHLLGQRFSYLTVEKQLPSKNWKTCWLCKCDCGNYCEKYGVDLVHGYTTSCGCKNKEFMSKLGRSNFKDLAGQKRGLLTIIKRVEDKIYNGKSYVNYLCKCDCGKKIDVTASALSAGQISCGCLKRSRGEYQIFTFLKENGYNFQEQYKIVLDNDKNRYFDFALIDNKNVIGLIEFDGQQHFEEVAFFNKNLANNQERDRQKNQWSIDNNIPLLRISYKDYKNIESILKNFIKEINYEQSIE